MTWLEPVQRNRARLAMTLEGATKEGAGSGPVALSAQIRGDSPAFLIDCTIAVHPPAIHLDVGLVRPPGSADHEFVWFPATDELLRVTYHPAQNRGGRNAKAEFGRDRRQIAIAEPEPCRSMCSRSLRSQASRRLVLVVGCVRG